MVKGSALEESRNSMMAAGFESLVGLARVVGGEVGEVAVEGLFPAGCPA